MRVISLRLADDVDAALEAMCMEQGRDKADVVSEVVRRYVETARLQRALDDPALAGLYRDLATDDVALAEEGMAEYRRLLKTADGA